MVTIYDMAAVSAAESGSKKVYSYATGTRGGAHLGDPPGDYIALNGGPTDIWIHLEHYDQIELRVALTPWQNNDIAYLNIYHTSATLNKGRVSGGAHLGSQTISYTSLLGTHQWVIHIDGATWSLYRAEELLGQFTAAKTEDTSYINFTRHSSAGKSSTNIRQIYIADEYLPNAFVEVLRPNGNGALSEFVGSDGNSIDNYLLIDEETPSAADYVGTGATGKTDLYTLTDTGADVSEVFAIKPHIYAMKSDAGTAPDLNILQREADGTTRTTATDPISTAGMAYTVQPVVNTKPSGGAWTKAVVDGLQIGLGT